jgi:adenylate cyclase
MPGSCLIKVYDKQALVFSGDFGEPVELGRQSRMDEKLYTQTVDSGHPRVVVARLEEQTVSRKHLLIQPIAEDRVRLTNVSSRQAVRLLDGTELQAQESQEMTLPIVFTLGTKTVRLQEVEEEVPVERLAEATTPPGQVVSAGESTMLVNLPAGSAPSPAVLIRMLKTAQDVLHSATNSIDFFAKAAQAVVDLVGLDSGRVLIWENGTWQTRAFRGAAQLVATPPAPPSRQVLSRVRQEKRTLWQVPEQSAAHQGSLVGVKSVVAAPILDRQGEVIGVLYGDRWRESANLFTPVINELQAMLVELLAGGVAAGLARLEMERAALAARVQFEQFFTPELAHKLEVEPDLLKGRDTDVTVLFCDIRGFSRISERLGSAKTVEWIGDVMGELSDCVLRYQGVLVDYIGDELMAMWGAPASQPDHAVLACRAALAMLDSLPRLNERWQSTLEEPMAFGIGINAGLARVGNVGTSRKFKYGPLGNSVNLASRVQGASKYLQATLLITGSVQAYLGSEFASRRLCKVRVVNIAEPVDLYELAPLGEPGWDHLKQEYELALSKFENQEFRPAARILGKLASDHPDDGPTLVLLSRAVHYMVDPSTFKAVWELTGK